MLVFGFVVREALDAFLRVTGQGGVLAGGALPAEKRPKVLILTEEVSAMLGEEVRDWQMGAEYPLVVEIPGLQGHIAGHFGKCVECLAGRIIASFRRACRGDTTESSRVMIVSPKPARRSRFCSVSAVK